MSTIKDQRPTEAVSGLVSLRTVCRAREDVLTSGLADNHFAAQLDKVVRDPDHYPIYGDPDRFFAQTYPTSGLRTLLTKTFGRLTRANGPAGENGVLRPTTSFGGGKTHGLTAIYHVGKGARPGNIENFVDPTLLPDGPVQVAALVGDALDPVAGVETNGIRTYTLWGEMAAQAGPDAYTVVAANDAERTAPGTATIKEAFGRKPAIVIVDEIAKYLRQVTSSGSEDVRRMARAIPVFLGNLFEVASDPTNRVVVIITLAASTNAFGAETDEIDELLEDATSAANAAVSETADLLARAVQPSAVIKPADDTEIGEILKTRLFEHIDPDAARAAGDAYRDLYESLARNESLAGGAERPVTYGDAVARSYPFHPELVRVLDKRLGDIPQFQRARGALKLLAEVVAGIYREGDDCAVINVADIDYGSGPVLNHLTDGLGRGEFAGVARGDFAGATSHAEAVDDEVFPGRPPYATRVARTVFTHSLEMKVNVGAARNDWLLGTLRPGEDPAILEKALTESEKVFWHLAFDGARWRFNVEPNVNAILETEKRNIANTRVSAVVDDLIVRAYSNDGGVGAIHFPAGPSEVPDQPNLRVVVVHHNVLTASNQKADQPAPILVEMLDQVGSSGAPRKYRNAVAFVVADETQVEALKDRARALIAADTLAVDRARLGQFSTEIRKKIEAYQKNAALEARVAVTRCYKHVYYPANEKASGYLRHRDLPPEKQGDTKTATSAVLNLLIDEGKIRNEPFTYSYLRSKTWPEPKRSVTTTEIADWFWIDHTSPIIRNPSLLREAIVGGIKNDSWVYYDATTGKAYTANTMAGLSVEFRSDAEVMTVAEATGRGLLVRKPTQSDLKNVYVGPSLTGAEIRARLEPECGGEPSKTEVLDLLATAVHAAEYKWIIVLDSEPASGVRALTPSQIRDKGLDALNVVTRDYADTKGIEVPTRSVTGKTFAGSGPGGAAIQSVTDQVSDFSIKTISRLTIKVIADDIKGTGDLDLLVMALGMLPKHAITVATDLVAEYRNVTGGIAFRGSAARADFQTAYGHIIKAVKGASKVAGTLTLNLAFTPPVTVDSPEFKQVHKVVKDLQIQHADLAAEVTK
ncbi:ATP-binding protein [Micromonospora sp. WMMA1923]|uniref:ATP-binding protein n=1 Tax=Micromonospora sp. WMMA1923 TaxID=3404125 RepID=UPI003B932E81